MVIGVLGGRWQLGAQGGRWLLNECRWEWVMSGRVLVSGEREQFHPILCKIGAQIGLDQLKLGDLGDSWPPFFTQNELASKSPGF